MFFKRYLVSSACVLALTSGAVAAHGQDSVEQFYAGKTIDMIIGYAPGGGYDQYARLVARFLPEFIPGNPEIIARNMPGGGTRTAASYIYNVAPQDGTILGTFDQGLPLEQVLGITPIDGVDTAGFGYVGSPVTSNNVTVTWHESGIESIEQATAGPMTMGSTGSGGAQLYPMVMNARLNTQFEIIAGYPGGNDINLAMENGEVDGRGSNAWASYKAATPHFVNNDLINVLVQIGLEAEPDLPEVPLLIDLATNPSDEALFRLLSGPVALGRPIMTTPNVPEERLAALRAAFDAMVQDPKFLAAAAAENLDIINPKSGEQLQQIVQEIVSAEPATVQALFEIATAAQ